MSEADSDKPKGRPRSESEAEDLLAAWAAADPEQAAASADNLLRSGSAGLLRSSTSLHRIPSTGHARDRSGSSSNFLEGLQGAVAIGASPKLAPISATDVYREWLELWRWQQRCKCIFPFSSAVVC